MLIVSLLWYLNLYPCVMTEDFHNVFSNPPPPPQLEVISSYHYFVCICFALFTWINLLFLSHQVFILFFSGFLYEFIEINFQYTYKSALQSSETMYCTLTKYLLFTNYQIKLSTKIFNKFNIFIFTKLFFEILRKNKSFRSNPQQR